MSLLSFSYQKAFKITTATAMIIVGLSATMNPAKADNLAVSNQQADQVGVAVGVNNSVSNTINQFSRQNQLGLLSGGDNIAASGMVGSQTGVANGFGNNVNNDLFQGNSQRQTGAFGLGEQYRCLSNGSQSDGCRYWYW